MAAIVVIAVYLGVSAGNNLLESYHLVGEEERLEDEVVALQQELRQLEQVREYLRSDEYVEFMARRVFGLVMPGESLVVVDAPPSAPQGEEPEDLSWWQRLFGDY